MFIVFFLIKIIKDGSNSGKGELKGVELVLIFLTS
jgi:hypothetical protein